MSRRSVAASRTESAEREPVESSALPAEVVVTWLAEEVGNAIVWDRVTTVAECPNQNPPPPNRGVVTVAVLLYAEEPTSLKARTAYEYDLRALTPLSVKLAVLAETLAMFVQLRPLLDVRQT